MTIENYRNGLIRQERAQLQQAILGTTLWLCLWVATGNLARALAENDGRPGARSVLLGLGAVTILAAATLRSRGLALWIAGRPPALFLVGAALLAIPILDGIQHSPHVSLALTSIGAAVVVARARTVWLLVAMLMALHTAALVAQAPPAQFWNGSALGGIAGALVSYPIAAAMLLAVRAVISHAISAADQIVTGIAGWPSRSQIQASKGSRWPRRLLPPGPLRLSGLSPRERLVVEALASGSIAKQIARDWGVSVTTVRTHIRNAKRKTGAATLPELAALTASPDWPRSTP